MNVLAQIEQLEGTSNNKDYTVTDTDVRVEFIPISNEAIALYQMPQGQSYQFLIKGVQKLKQQSRITITDKQDSEFNDGDVFITVTDTKAKKLFGRIYQTGLCYKK